MKHHLNILLLLGAAMFLPTSAWAIYPVEDIAAEISLVFIEGTTLDIAANTTVSAAADVDLLFNDNYNTWYNWNPALGEALAMTPEFSPSMAAMMAKQYHELASMHQELNRQADSQMQKPKMIYLTPKELWAKIKSFRAGDVTKIIRDKIADEIDKIYAQLQEQYEKIVSGEMFANLIQDIASCRTPQLDTMFPKINVNAGFGMCDYKKMFNDMQDQVKSVSDKGWGGSFMINGQDAADVIKDPSLLKSSLHMIPPGQGRALVADFLSKESMNYSIQGGIDTSAIGNQIAGVLKHKDGYNFKPRTMIEAVNDSIGIGAMASKAQVTGTNATNQILAAQTKMKAMEFTREEQRQQAIERATAAMESEFFLGDL